MNEPTVYIVDDDAAVCDSLALLVGSVGLTVKTYASAVAFLDAYDSTSPGCVVLDVRMPGMSGLELQDIFNDRGYQIPVIVITAHGDMPTAVRAMKAGAIDCMAKPFHDQELVDRIQQAIATDKQARVDRAMREEITERVAMLTAREREVMAKVVRGMTNQLIATELGITKKTVDAHRAKVMEKMRANSLADLVQLDLKARGPL